MASTLGTSLEFQRVKPTQNKQTLMSGGLVGLGARIVAKWKELGGVTLGQAIGSELR